MNPSQGKSSPASEWLEGPAAARLLGVKRETLYAYASRGLVRSAPIAGSRRRRYAKADLLRLKARRDARAGHGPVAAGALRWGEAVLDTALTRISEDDFHYRGRAVSALLAQTTSFEAVAEFLWTGALPTARTRWNGTEIRPSRMLGRRDTFTLRRPLDAMTSVLALCAARETLRAEPTTSFAIARARALTRALAAASGAHRGLAAVRAAEDQPTVARSLLVAHGVRPTTARATVVDRALILCADHELNPSSFTARVVASTGADLHACLIAALGALSGPRHGGAVDRVEALLAQIGVPEAAASELHGRLARGEEIPGFGHTLYPHGDPRGPILLADAVGLAPRHAIVRSAIALRDAMRLVGGEGPNLDLGLATVAGALSLPPGSAVAIFAVGRVAGWIAHVLEQRAAGFLLRPRARYIGPP